MVRGNLTGNESTNQFFTFAVPAGASELNFQMSGGTGDADLYVKFAAKPNLNNYDCRPYLQGNDETCVIPEASAGTYHVMLRGYRDYSGVSLVASYTVPNVGGSLSKNNLSGEKGEFTHFRINIPEGITSLVVATQGGTGDADLYLREGKRPKEQRYDCRPYIDGNRELCVIANPNPGKWIISLRGYKDYAKVNLTAKWEP